MSDELLSAIEAAETESPDGFSGVPFDVQGSATFDLQASDVVVRPNVAVAAMQNPDATIQVYAWGDALIFHGCRLTSEATPPFVLFTYGHVANNSRFVDGALRIYDESEKQLQQIASNPSLAFATILGRYGIDYDASGKRVRFVPVVVIPAGLIDMTQPPTFERVWPVIALKLNIEIPAEEMISNMNMRLTPEGEIQLVWPFALDIHAYTADVRRFKSG